MSSAKSLEQLRRRIGHGSAPVAFAALAEEHRRAGRPEDAVAVCREGLERYPTYASARVTLGRALLDLGHIAEAVTELEEAVLQAPDNLAAARALGEAHLRLGDADAPIDDRAVLSGYAPVWHRPEAMAAGGDVPASVWHVAPAPPPAQPPPAASAWDETIYAPVQPVVPDDPDLVGQAAVPLQAVAAVQPPGDVPLMAEDTADADSPTSAGAGSQAEVDASSPWVRSLRAAVAEVFSDAVDTTQPPADAMAMGGDQEPGGLGGPAGTGRAADRELEALESLLAAVRARRAALAVHAAGVPSG